MRLRIKDKAISLQPITEAKERVRNNILHDLGDVEVIKLDVWREDIYLRAEAIVDIPWYKWIFNEFLQLIGLK